MDELVTLRWMVRGCSCLVVAAAVLFLVLNWALFSLTGGRL